MTKKTLQLLASVAVVAGLGFTGVTANADSTTSTGTTTTGNVTLTAGTTDPDNPGGDAGGINLKTVPYVNVPSTAITGSDQSVTGTVSATESGTSNDGVVQVVNPGHKSDWTVQVAATAFKSSDDTMNASTLVLGTPTIANADTDGTGVAPSTLNQAITFNTGETTANQNVEAADYSTNKEGVGTWNTTYSGATLNLKAGNVAGAYQSTLTWTLTNTPTA